MTHQEPAARSRKEPPGAGEEAFKVQELHRGMTQLISETLRSQGEREQGPAGQPQDRGLGLQQEQEQEFQGGHTGMC